MTDKLQPLKIVCQRVLYEIIGVLGHFLIKIKSNNEINICYNTLCSIFEGSTMQTFKVQPCVGSGLCCKTGSCGYGVWSESKKQCGYLEEGLKDNGVTIYRCGRYEYIKQQPGNEMMPAFGAGCCMTLFNTDRVAIVRKIKEGNRKVINFLL